MEMGEGGKGKGCNIANAIIMNHEMFMWRSGFIPRHNHLFLPRLAFAFCSPQFPSFTLIQRKYTHYTLCIYSNFLFILWLLVLLSW